MIKTHTITPPYRYLDTTVINVHKSTQPSNKTRLALCFLTHFSMFYTSVMNAFLFIIHYIQHVTKYLFICQTKQRLVVIMSAWKNDQNINFTRICQEPTLQYALRLLFFVFSFVFLGGKLKYQPDDQGFDDWPFETKVSIVCHSFFRRPISIVYCLLLLHS